MNWIFGANQFLEDPIIELLEMRSESPNIPNDLQEVFERDELFQKIPILTKKSIKTISDKLHSHEKLSKTLHEANFQLNFSPEDEEILKERFSKRKNIVESSTITLFFHCLNWISTECETRSNQSLDFYMKCMNQVINTRFTKILNSIFVSLIDEMDDDEHFEWTSLTFLQIFQHFYINKSLRNEIEKPLLKISKKVKLYGDFTAVNSYMCLLDGFFKEEELEFSTESLEVLLEVVEDQFRQLQPTAFSIFVLLSEKHPLKMITNCFMRLDNIMVEVLRKGPKRYTEEDFYKYTPYEGKAENSILGTDGFPMPPPSSVGEENTSLLDVCPSVILPSLIELRDSLNRASLEVKEMVANTFLLATERLRNSDIYPDFMILFIVIAECVAESTGTVEKFFEILMNSFIFSSRATIFHGQLNQCQQVTRNSILLLALKCNYLPDLLTNTSYRPLIMSEVLTRIIYRMPENCIDSLKKCGLEQQLVSAIMNVPAVMKDVNTRVAKSVPLAFLFEILDDPKEAQRCFSSETMCPGILSLVFEKELAQPLILNLTKALAMFTSIPNTIVKFAKTMIASCINADDFSYIALLLVNNLMTAVVQNALLASSFKQIFDITLMCVKANPNIESLNKVITVFTLISQSEEFFFTEERLTAFIEIIEKVYGNSPPEALLFRIRNMLSKSINTGSIDVFDISNYSVLPLLLIAFSKSPLLSEVINLLNALCAFTENNCIQCNKGNADLILAKALKGPFVFFNIKVEFIIPDDLYNDIYKLFAQIAAVRSSFNVVNTFISLMLPTKDNKFSKTTLPILTTLTTLVSNSMHYPSPIFNSSMKEPSLLYTVQGSVFNSDYVIAMWLHVDSNSLISNGNSFHLFKAVDEVDWSIDLYVQNEQLILRFDNDMITCAPIVKNLPPAQWMFVVVSVRCIEPEFHVLTSINHKVYDEITFRPTYMTGTTEISIGFSDKDFSTMPVAIGPISMFADPTKTAHHVLAANGIDALQNPIFNETMAKPGPCPLPKDKSLIGVLKKKISALEFLPIFRAAANAPPHVIELTCGLISFALKAPTRSCIKDFRESKKLIEQITNTDLSNINMHETDIELGELSAMIYLSVVSIRPLQPSLFQAFASIKENAIGHKDELNKILFNLLIWSDANENNFRRIIGHWQSLQPHVFGSVLAQSLLLPKISKQLVFRALEPMCFELTKNEEEVLMGAALTDKQNAKAYIRFMIMARMKPDLAMTKIPPDEESFVEMYRLFDSADVSREYKTLLAVNSFQLFDSEISFEDPDIVSIRTIVRGVPFTSLPQTLLQRNWSLLPAAATAACSEDKSIIFAEFACNGIVSSSNIYSEYVYLLAVFDSLDLLGFNTWEIRCSTISRVLFALIADQDARSRIDMLKIIKISLSSLFFRATKTNISNKLLKLFESDDSGITSKEALHDFQRSDNSSLTPLAKLKQGTSVLNGVTVKFKIDVNSDDSALLSTIAHIFQAFSFVTVEKESDSLIYDFISEQKTEVCIPERYSSLFDRDSYNRLPVISVNTIKHVLKEIQNLVAFNGSIKCSSYVDKLKSAQEDELSATATIFEFGRLLSEVQ